PRPERHAVVRVVAEDLVDPAPPLPGALLQPGGVALVELGARLLGEPEVGSVANQDVPEAEAIVPREERKIWLDEILSRQGEERGADVAVRQRPNRTAAELAPAHGP